MSHEKLRPEFLFDEEKIKHLKQIAPECFEDGKINFETLKQNLGDWAQDHEDSELEHFGLFWPGKKDARKIAAIPPEGTLVPVYGEGLKADGTPDTDGVNDSKNIFIEGENLEVLKILQKSYAGKIKMIYIDPPYNTGNDFVYDDDFTEPLQEYLRRTGQVDEEGKALTTNKRSDGRFHSKWLSMIYPRLKLAKNLLKEDGVIFISIDDNEIHNLRAICNEVFGEESFISQFIWKSRQIVDSRAQNGVSNDHEYILVYSNSDQVRLRGRQIDVNKYSNPDNDPRGLWMSNSILGLATASQRPNLHYKIKDPKTNIEYDCPPDSGWRYSVQTMNQKIEDERIIFPKKKDGRPREKKYLSELENQFTNISSILSTELGYTLNGTREVREIMNGNLFSFPKPTSLIKALIQQGSQERGDLVLDFFSGSGTIAQACVELNHEEEIQRNFVAVQLPEICDEKSEAYIAGFKTLAEVSKERIRRSLGSINDKTIDRGFASVKLDKSSYKKWTIYSGTSVSELEENLNLFNQEPLREDWTKEGLLSEIILIEGFVLSSTIEKQEQYAKNEVKKVSDEYCEHSLLVCLDAKIDPETIESLDLSGSDIFVCLDNAISNVDKLKLSDKGLIKTI